MTRLGAVILTVASACALEATSPAIAADELSIADLIQQLETRQSLSRFKEAEFEGLLQQLIKRGSAAEEPLKTLNKRRASSLAEAQAKRDKLDVGDSDEDLSRWVAAEVGVDRLSANLELMTALRRIQRQPDPLSIEIVQPGDLKGTPGALPSIKVQIISSDVDKTPLWLSDVIYYSSRRQAQWRIEVRNAEGQLMPDRSNPVGRIDLSGRRHWDWLKYGEYMERTLSLSDYVKITEPGRYTVTLVYHSCLPISEEFFSRDLDQLLTYRSHSYPLEVTDAERSGN
jgi:hypothetical protein